MSAPISRRHALAILGASALTPVAACSPSSTPPPAPAGPLHFLSLREVAKLLAARQVLPVTLTRQMLDRIFTVDAKLTSYATVTADQAIAAATAAEKEINAGKYRGPLH